MKYLSEWISDAEERELHWQTVKLTEGGHAAEVMQNYWEGRLEGLVDAKYSIEYTRLEEVRKVAKQNQILQLLVVFGMFAITGALWFL